MDMLETIHARRSIRDYAAAPVPRETLLELVDAARYAPSGANRNRWHFVIITSPESLARLAAIHIYCRWLAFARAAIAITIEPVSTRYWLEDCCAAAATILLTAAARGLGATWGNMHQSDNPALTAQWQKTLREIMSMPETAVAPVVLGVGYPAATPPPRKQPALEQIVSWETYANHP